MKLGIALPIEVRGLRGDTLVEWMSRIDNGPFETIAVVDETVTHSYESLTTLAAAAAVTQRARLMSVVIACPLRNATILAKQAASIDALSGGRLSLGLGVGELVEDFSAVGVEMRGRGKRFEEQLAHMKRIWAGEPMGESGRAIGPPPVQQGGPELLIGGWAPRAMARIGRFADGYAGAIMAEEMITDEPYQLAAQSWHEHQRPGKPRFVQNIHVALGPDASDALDSYLAGAYAFEPDLIPEVRRVTPKSDGEVRQIIERLDSIGVDELIFHPVTADIEQLQKLEQAAG